MDDRTKMGINIHRERDGEKERMCERTFKTMLKAPLANSTLNATLTFQTFFNTISRNKCVLHVCVWLLHCYYRSLLVWNCQYLHFKSDLFYHFINENTQRFIALRVIFSNIFGSNVRDRFVYGDLQEHQSMNRFLISVNKIYSKLHDKIKSFNLQWHPMMCCDVMRCIGDQIILDVSIFHFPVQMIDVWKPEWNNKRGKINCFC